MSTKSKEMLLTPLGPGLAVKVLKPVIVHSRVVALEQVWRLTSGVASVMEVRERRGRREKCMAFIVWVGDMSARVWWKESGWENLRVKVFGFDDENEDEDQYGVEKDIEGRERSFYTFVTILPPPPEIYTTSKAWIWDEIV